MEIKVSIVVAIYNGEAYIEQCMKCIKNQTYKNLEIILVDDGSNDKTAQMCDTYAQKDDRIKVIHKQNGGVSSARNVGIESASGEYIFFYDVDDIIDANLIEENVALAKEYDADEVFFCFRYHNLDTGKIHENAMEHLFVGDQDSFFTEEISKMIDNEVFNAPWNILVKRSVLVEKKILFNAEYPIFEDIDFNTTLLSAMKKIVVNPKVYYTYMVRSKGSLITQFYEKNFDVITQIYSRIKEYSMLYPENEKQLKSAGILYIRMTFLYLKQLSCQNDIEWKKKKELSKKVCETELFREALERAQMYKRKNWMKQLILKKRYKMIIFMYRTFSYLQKL